MGWWFGRKAAPDDLRPFVPEWLGAGQEEGFARAYDSQFEEVYRRNPVGQRAVRLICGMLGSLPIYSLEGPERALELVQADGFLEAAAASVLLHGNAYMQVIADDTEAPARLALQLLDVGQAQKEMLHNEALQSLDFVVAAAVEEPPRASPPAAPVIGSCYIVASNPTGLWAGNANKLAGWSAGGWRLIAPLEGMVAYVRSVSVWAVFRAGAWELGTLRGSSLTLGGKQVVGPRLPAISGPSGGSTVDVQSRATIGEILNALRQHGLIEP